MKYTREVTAAILSPITVYIIGWSHAYVFDAVIDEQFFGDHLYTANIDDPDLLIRTSGELRVSNFLLWQIAYAEIHVTKVLWPDFRRRHLFEAIIDFQSRERRYGAVDESDAQMFIEADRST